MAAQGSSSSTMAATTPDTPAASPPSSSSRNNILSLAVLALLAGVLWGTRPAATGRSVPANVKQTRGCISNLNRIAAAMAQYAQDNDGRFPRGVDAEDRNQPQNWPVWRIDGKMGDARDLPLLHELLFPYLHDRAVWRCPADVGWDTVQLPNVQSSLRNVKPSSYARYGTSYYYFTWHGIDGWRAVDIAQPGLNVLLFDGDAWHQTGGSPSLNILFADGHVQNVTVRRFGELMELDSQNR